MNSMVLGIGDIISNAVVGIFSFIPKLMFFIVTCLLSVLDLFQVCFRKLAGLDTMYVNGVEQSGDTIYNIITGALFRGEYPAFQTAFWSLVVLGVFMLILTSIIQVIRLEYAPPDKVSQTSIIKNFIKTLFNFAIIPITCFFAMYLSNSLVRIVDTATSTTSTVSAEYRDYFSPWSGTSATGVVSAEKESYIAYEVFGLSIPTRSETFSGMVFKASAYGCNRVRNSGDFFNDVVVKNGNNLGITEQNQTEFANILDVAFASNVKLKSVHNLSTGDAAEYFVDTFGGTFGRYKNLDHCSKYNVSMVFYFYDLWQFNYIVAFLALITMLKLYWGFTFYLMKRMFEIGGLFLVSPIAISLTVFDNGKAINSWKESFMSKNLAAITLVASMNLVTPLMQIAQGISLFKIPIIDYIINTLFLIAALQAVNSLNDAIKSIVGSGGFGETAGSAKAMMDDLTTGATGAYHIGKAAVGATKLVGKGGLALTHVPKAIGKKVSEVNANKRMERARKIEEEQKRLDREAYEKSEAYNKEGNAEEILNDHMEKYKQNLENKESQKLDNDYQNVGIEAKDLFKNNYEEFSNYGYNNFEDGDTYNEEKAKQSIDLNEVNDEYTKQTLVDYQKSFEEYRKLNSTDSVNSDAFREGFYKYHEETGKHLREKEREKAEKAKQRKIEKEKYSYESVAKEKAKSERQRDIEAKQKIAALEALEAKRKKEEEARKAKEAREAKEAKRKENLSKTGKDTVSSVGKIFDGVTGALGFKKKEKKDKKGK